MMIKTEAGDGLKEERVEVQDQEEQQDDVQLDGIENGYHLEDGSPPEEMEVGERQEVDDEDVRVDCKVCGENVDKERYHYGGKKCWLGILLKQKRVKADIFRVTEKLL